MHIVVNVNVIVILRQVNDEAFCRVLIYEQSWTEQQLKVGSFKFTEHVFISLLLMFCKTRSADWHSLSFHVSTNVCHSGAIHFLLNLFFCFPVSPMICLQFRWWMLIINISNIEIIPVIQNPRLQIALNSKFQVFLLGGGCSPQI